MTIITDQQLENLISRVQLLEDQQAIAQLMATHPLSVDGGDGENWLTNWTEDAQVDRLPDPEKHSGDYSGVYGKDMMLQEIHSPELEALRKSGLCHSATPSKITIDGDRAAATNYLLLIGVEDTGVRIRRILVSRWDFVRAEGRWMITRRTMRPVGNEDALNLALKAVRPLQDGEVA